MGSRAIGAPRCRWLGAVVGSRWALPAILLLGVALQLATLFAVIDPDDLFWPDPKIHHAVGRDLAEGRPFSTPGGETRLKLSPGYPYLLSLMMRLVGPGVLPIRLVHVALFPLFLLALHRLGTRWGGRAVGLTLAAVGAVYPLFVYLPLTLYPESVLIYLFGAIALVLSWVGDRFSWPRLLLLGLLVAAGAFVRPTSVVWVPVALWFLAWRRLGLARSLAIAALLLVLPGLVATGWMARNRSVHGAFTFSTVGGWSLLTTFNENRTGLDKELSDIPAEIEARLRQAPTVVEKERISREEALRFIREHPVRSLRIAGLQWLSTWSPVPQTYTRGGLASLKYKLALGLPYAVLLALGVGGIVILRRDRFVRALVALMLLNTGLAALFNVSVRYRAVTDIGFLLPAAFVICLVLGGRSACGRPPLPVEGEPPGRSGAGGQVGSGPA